MNDTAQIIIAVATLITSLGSVIVALVNKTAITTIQSQTNGMMKKLEEAAGAKGNLQGRADERREHLLDKDEPVKVEITKIPPLKP